jgi:phage anti-repressor protein
MAEEFIPVLSANIDGQEVNAVNARELWKGLEVGRDFATWIKGKVQKYQFVEGVDFVRHEVFPQTGENSLGGRPETDYILTLDMAKELAMVENNEQGRKTRQYFIRIEKDHKKIAAAIAEGKMKGLLEAHDKAVKDIQLTLTTAHNKELDRIGEAYEELEETAHHHRTESERWMRRAHHSESEVARLESDAAPVCQFGELNYRGIPKTQPRRNTFAAPRSMAEASIYIQSFKRRQDEERRRFIEQFLDFDYERRAAQ